MGDHTAFFYGTLMAPGVLHRVCHGTPEPTAFQKSLLTTRPALLPAYRRHKVRHADYPAILPDADPAACVRGTLVTGLTDGDIWRLDIFEGDEYERKKVKVKVLRAEKGIDAAGVAAGKVEETDEEVVAETYVWIAGKRRLEDAEWDFEEFVKEKIGRWVGKSADHEYTEVDDAVAAQNSDPTGGRGSNGTITRALQEEKKNAV